MSFDPKTVHTPQIVEEAYPGIICEWFYEKRIVAYRLTNVSKTIIDAWGDLTLRILNEWDKTRPYLALHDVSATGISLQYATLVGFDLMNIGITATGRDAGEAVFNAYPDFRARVSIGFNLSVSGQVSQVVMDRIKMKHPSITYKTFFNRERSLAWLVDAFMPKPPVSTDQTQEMGTSTQPNIVDATDLTSNAPIHPTNDVHV